MRVLLLCWLAVAVGALPTEIEKRNAALHGEIKKIATTADLHNLIEPGQTMKCRNCENAENDEQCRIDDNWHMCSSDHSLCLLHINVNEQGEVERLTRRCERIDTCKNLMNNNDPKCGDPDAKKSMECRVCDAGIVLTLPSTPPNPKLSCVDRDGGGDVCRTCSNQPDERACDLNGEDVVCTNEKPVCLAHYHTAMADQIAMVTRRCEAEETCRNLENDNGKTCSTGSENSNCYSCWKPNHFGSCTIKTAESESTSTADATSPSSSSEPKSESSPKTKHNTAHKKHHSATKKAHHTSTHSTGHTEHKSAPKKKVHHTSTHSTEHKSAPKKKVHHTSTHSTGKTSHHSAPKKKTHNTPTHTGHTEHQSAPKKAHHTSTHSTGKTSHHSAPKKKIHNTPKHTGHTEHQSAPKKKTHHTSTHSTAKKAHHASTHKQAKKTHHTPTHKPVEEKKTLSELIKNEYKQLAISGDEDANTPLEKTIRSTEYRAEDSSRLTPSGGLQRCRTCDKMNSEKECDDADNWDICNTDSYMCGLSITVSPTGDVKELSRGCQKLSTCQALLGENSAEWSSLHCKNHQCHQCTAGEFVPKIPAPTVPANVNCIEGTNPGGVCLECDGATSEEECSQSGSYSVVSQDDIHGVCFASYSYISGTLLISRGKADNKKVAELVKQNAQKCKPARGDAVCYATFEPHTVEPCDASGGVSVQVL